MTRTRHQNCISHVIKMHNSKTDIRDRLNRHTKVIYLHIYFLFLICCSLSPALFTYSLLTGCVNQAVTTYRVEHSDNRSPYKEHLDVFVQERSDSFDGWLVQRAKRSFLLLLC